MVDDAEQRLLQAILRSQLDGLLRGVARLPEPVPRLLGDRELRVCARRPRLRGHRGLRVVGGLAGAPGRHEVGAVASEVGRCDAGHHHRAREHGEDHEGQLPRAAAAPRAGLGDGGDRRDDRDRRKRHQRRDLPQPVAGRLHAEDR